MTKLEISRAFDKCFNGQPNFMTPRILNVGETDKYIYELSEGEGIERETIYGLTFLTKEGKRIEKNDPSQMVRTLHEASKIIKAN